MAEDQSNRVSPATHAPKLLDRLRLRLQRRGIGLDMQNRYVEWCRQFILFHRLRHPVRHPAEMGAEEVAQFLHELRARRLSMGWQREAWQALGFLYREELGRVVALPDLRRHFPSGAVGTAVEPVVPAPRRELSAVTAPLQVSLPQVPAPLERPRLMEQVRAVLRVRHYSLGTEDCYVLWIKRFILFQGRRHPAEMGGPQVQACLTYLAWR